MPKSASLGSRIRKEYVPGLDVVVDDVRSWAWARPETTSAPTRESVVSRSGP
jgi:hypothetical protein